MVKQKQVDKIRNHLHSNGRLQTWYMDKDGWTIRYTDVNIDIDEPTKHKLMQSEKRVHEANKVLHRSALANDRVHKLPPIPGDV